MKRLVTIAASLLLAVSVNAQITIDQSTLQGLYGKILTEVSHEPTDTTGLAALMAQSGTNQTWDITGYTWVADDTSSAEFRNGIAGTAGENDPDFSTANLAQVSSGIEEGVEIDLAFYARVEASGFFLLGYMFTGDFDDDGSPDTTKSLYTPAELDLAFPFTYGTMISDSVNHRSWLADTLVVDEEVAKDGEVDGWGTLVTPDGSFDVIRYRYEERTYVEGFVFLDTTIEWWGQTGPILSVYQSGTPGFEFADMRYSRQTISDPTSTDDVESSIPHRFALQQNYPNPFNPSTIIPFDLETSAVVELAIYDMLGRRVQTLADGRLPAGSHTVTWEAENLPGGIYIARLSVDGQTQSRTMTFLK